MQDLIFLRIWTHRVDARIVCDIKFAKDTWSVRSFLCSIPWLFVFAVFVFIFLHYASIKGIFFTSNTQRQHQETFRHDAEVSELLHRCCVPISPSSALFSRQSFQKTIVFLFTLRNRTQAQKGDRVWHLVGLWKVSIAKFQVSWYRLKSVAKRIPCHLDT